MKQPIRTPIKTVYYRDEANDEFSRAVITPKRIDGSWRYLPKNRFFYFVRFLLYRVIAVPLAFLYCRLSLGYRIRGRRAIKQVGKQGFFLFGNHTQEMADAFFPSFVAMPRSVYIVVHPNNVSQPVLGRLTPYLGALPLPDGLAAMKGFKEAVGTRIEGGCCVTIYPEAHIWPYYTGVRPYPSTAFSFPVNLDVPSFAMTTTYRRRRFRKKPRAVVMVDGPFYPDTSLPPRRRAEDLRDRIYAAMKARCAESDQEYIRYERAPDAADGHTENRS